MAIFCTLYYICSYICAVPQVVKLIKTKSSNDYSLWAYGISTIGLICWSIYIFTTQQHSIVYIGTVVDLLLILLEDVLILIFYKFKKDKNYERKV